MKETLELSDIQGLLVRGYANLPSAAFLLLHVDDPAGARTVLSDWADAVTSGERHPDHTATNIALTAGGVQRITGRDELPVGFSYAFASGMTNRYRSRLLGDSGEDDPQGWRWGGPSTEDVHVLLLLYARGPQVVEDRVRQVTEQAHRGGLRLLERLDTDLLSDREHFGFRDGISQPTIAGLARAEHSFDVVAAGEFVLGYLNEYGQRTERPMVPTAEDPRRLLAPDRDGSGAADLGRNGSYLVFRHLRQDVEGFWKYLDDVTQVDGVSDPEGRDRLAAKFVGRWRSGAPLVLSPDRDDESYASENAFGYHRSDPFGRACPIGAHVRRTNPRDSLDPAPGTRRSWEVGRRHRLLRRGRSYSGYEGSSGADVAAERGVHFLCLNANLARQYEFVQHSWVNDPAFNALEGSDDALIGARRHGASVFAEPAWPVRRRYHDLARFVQVRGGAYFFLPGITALRYISSVSGPS
jgi:Dyp-type peroxidase family